MSRIFRKSTEVYQRVGVTRPDGKIADCRWFSPGIFCRGSAVGCIWRERLRHPTKQGKARRLVVTKILGANAGWRFLWKIEQFKRDWSAIGRRLTQTISTSNMKSITRMPCWIIRNRESGFTADATFKKAGSSSQMKSGLQSGEVSAAEISGSPNSHSPMTVSRHTPSASWNSATVWWSMRRNISQIASSHHPRGHIL